MTMLNIIPDRLLQAKEVLSMKLTGMTIPFLTLMIVLGIETITNPAIARTQDTGSDPFNAAIRDQVNSGEIYVTDTSNQIDDFLGDVRDFVQDDLLSPVNNLIRSVFGVFQIPDLSQLWSQVMGGAASTDPGAVLSEALENKTDGESSYGIREDLSKDATRVAVTGVADQETLSQDAQAEMVEVRQATQQDTQESVRLGEESQSLDVTQQILQNLSQQTALESQVSERMLQEAQQARVDRALGNTLSVQMARELSAITTADRRRNIAAGNAASQQGGLWMMPGGITLDTNE
jgi:hypothetical protein